MSRHVHINALNRHPAGTNVIMLAIRGPHGGMRAIEPVSIDEAEKMTAQLQAAIAAARIAAPTDPVDAFMQDVIARLGDPQLACDPSFRTWCSANHGLLSARQTAERWCCWRVA
jgi:uncharacterized protein with beta-barrel porin domain